MIDPELGDNIVDLGMVRGASVDSSGRVDVEVALTVASCPLRGQIHDDVSARLGALPGVTSVEVRTGTMNREEKAALMDRARRKAQEDKAATVDFPPPPGSSPSPRAKAESESPPSRSTLP